MNEKILLVDDDANVLDGLKRLLRKEISIREMSTGMILDEDLRLSNGMLMVARNQEITYPLLVRIRNFCQNSPAPSKIRVKVPQRAAPHPLEMKDQAVLQPGR